MEPVDSISLWKKKSEIDYIPLFMLLWLSFNVWMKSRWTHTGERALIDEVKSMDRGGLKNAFIDLIQEKNQKSLTFRGYFGELHRALEKAEFKYDPNIDGIKKSKNQNVSFSNCIIKWNGGKFKTVSLVKLKTEHDNKLEDDETKWSEIENDETEDDEIEIDSRFAVKNEPENIFAAYIEILYQVRHIVFHGNLKLTQKHERVIKYLYLTLTMIMEEI